MVFSSAEGPECGISRFLSLLDGPWATLIVRELLTGPRRFGELRDALPGISAHTLTHRLRRFEAYGIVTRTAYAEMPPRVEYELTDIGHGLRQVLDAMNSWARTVPEARDEEDVVELPASCADIGAGELDAGVRELRVVGARRI
ncbi:helix-turn-helix transcriptional regulator [Agromyces atrinae]|uniref:winged helix-turn-helix transcriptional regulator n=1 Tax=Agromyces atrinae TaxID=592376 RepID=UPI001F58CCF7|nr:helix-turn-helix domain-containing protein [Agromyces atrinae]MCI2957033.1 helix-turn-helix transcriptional regulator [Agromyces atrinae]